MSAHAKLHTREGMLARRFAGIGEAIATPAVALKLAFEFRLFVISVSGASAASEVLPKPS